MQTLLKLHEEKCDRHQYLLTQFVTGSRYKGQWENFSMTGVGEYTQSNGVVYKGGFLNGNFHGYGELVYPSGYKIRARWANGIPHNIVFIFNDELIFSDYDWDYCTDSDRRYNFEIINGLKPIGLHSLTSIRNDNLPNGCYDTGDGYYCPKKKYVVDSENGKIIRFVYSR